jgi:hypothetical protein
MLTRDAHFGVAQQPYWVSSVICPRAVMLDDGICDDEKLSHGGGDGDFGSFPSARRCWLKARMVGLKRMAGNVTM